METRRCTRPSPIRFSPERRALASKCCAQRGTSACRSASACGPEDSSSFSTSSRRLRRWVRLFLLRRSMDSLIMKAVQVERFREVRRKTTSRTKITDSERKHVASIPASTHSMGERKLLFNVALIIWNELDGTGTIARVNTCQ